MTTPGQQPAGGFGAQQPPNAPMTPAYGPPPSSSPLVGILIGLGVVVGLIGILAVLAIYGVRRYLVDAKSAEARNTVSQIAKDAAASYESRLDGTKAGAADAPNGPPLCGSASTPVPSDPTMISGGKYASVPADWEKDKASDAGFYCLRFDMSSPQYYQYDYHSTRATFEAIARGDLNGNGVYSRFTMRGKITDGALTIAPSLEEENPTE